MSASLIGTGAPVAFGQTPDPTSPPAEAHPSIATALDLSELTFDPARATDDERRLIQGVIDGLYPAMVQIQSGHVVITGVTRGSSGTEYPYDAELYFDMPADRVMWSLRTARGDYTYGRNDEESFTITQIGRGRKIALVKLRTEPPAVKFARPLDPRGLPYLPAVMLHPSTPLDDYWNFWKRFLDLDHVQRFRRLDEGAVELVLSIPIQPAAGGLPRQESWSRIVLDDRSGGHPVVVEEWLRQESDEEPHLHWRNTTAWKEVDSQWVPVEWRSEHPGKMLGNLRLDWKSVNKEIDERHFQLPRFD